MALKDKEKLFCEYYVRFMCRGTKAAIATGYSPDSARYRSRDLLKKKEVQEYIAELQEEWRQRVGVTTERVLKELTTIAFSNMRDFATWNQSGADIIPAENLSRSKCAAIKKVRHHFDEGGGETVVELHDKSAALEKLCKHLGLFNDKSEVEHKGQINVTVKRLTGK